MRFTFPLLGSMLGVLAVLGCGCGNGIATDSSPPNESVADAAGVFRLPGGQVAALDCEVTWEEGAPPVDLATWLEASDDFIVGTVGEIRTVWNPLSLRNSTASSYVEPAQCESGFPAVDLQLLDVESLAGGQLAGELTVRLNGATWPIWGGAWPVANIGEQIQQWSNDGQAPLVAGMRLGGAVYRMDDATLVFMSNREPLFQVVNDRVMFQNLLGADGYCGPTLIPTVRGAVEALDGLSIQDAAQRVLEAATADSNPILEQYVEETIQLNDPEVRRWRTAAVCHHLVSAPDSDSGNTEDCPEPCACQVDADCELGTRCHQGQCVPQG